MLDYGEPWAVHDAYDHDCDESYSFVRDRHGGGFMRGKDVYRSWQARAVACVNALAGCRPEKLGALLEALDRVQSVEAGEDYTSWERRYHAIFAALAAFRPPAPEEGSDDA